jgi:hypothetical protein
MACCCWQFLLFSLRKYAVLVSSIDCKQRGCCSREGLDARVVFDGQLHRCSIARTNIASVPLSPTVRAVPFNSVVPVLFVVFFLRHEGNRSN